MRHHLNALKKCACLSYFQSNAFDNFAILKGYEYTTQTSTNGIEVSKQEYESLRRVLEATFHLSRNKENIRVLINNGTLMSLMEILKLFHNDLDMKYLLSKIIANLSICKEFNTDFFVSGEITKSTNTFVCLFLCPVDIVHPFILVGSYVLIHCLKGLDEHRKG